MKRSQFLFSIGGLIASPFFPKINEDSADYILTKNKFSIGTRYNANELHINSKDYVKFKMPAHLDYYQLRKGLNTSVNGREIRSLDMGFENNDFDNNEITVYLKLA